MTLQDLPGGQRLNPVELEDVRFISGLNVRKNDRWWWNEDNNQDSKDEEGEAADKEQSTASPHVLPQDVGGFVWGPSDENSILVESQKLVFIIGNILELEKRRRRSITQLVWSFEETEASRDLLLEELASWLDIVEGSYFEFLLARTDRTNRVKTDKGMAWRLERLQGLIDQFLFQSF